MLFKDFHFSPKLEKAIFEAGFKNPSPIQELSIPHILEGKDLFGQAHTGTGKTAAFALPLLEKMTGNEGVETLVIVPTRELAIQLSDEIYKFSRLLNIRTTTIYGGTSYRRQIEHVKNAGVVVATPGRLLDLLERKKISLNPKYVVIDEADEMLNMGFVEDIRRIFHFFEERKQTLMFSATMPEEVKDLTETLMKKPLFVRVEQEETITNNNIKQYFYVVEEHERDEALVRLIDFSNPRKAIVFCRTKKETDRLSQFLKAQGYNAEALHGDMEQYDRRRVITGFRKGEYEILVATDVAARGLDIKNVSHVFNYHIPLDPESYVHRIGRTGRAEKSGIAMMLVTPHEMNELFRIQKDVGSKLEYYAIPHSEKNNQERVTELLSALDSLDIHKSQETLTTELKKHYSLQDLLNRLVILAEQSLKHKVLVGKSKTEIDELLKSFEHNSAHPDKELKKGRSSHYRNRKETIKRGTQRGEVPEPNIKKTKGGSRIVARKLY